MIVITSLEELEQINKSAVTIGKFDGLHKGHKALIEKTVDYAKKNNMKSVVFTFSNHTANFFESEKVRKIITNKDKINTMKDLGVLLYPHQNRILRIMPSIKSHLLLYFLQR